MVSSALLAGQICQIPPEMLMCGSNSPDLKRECARLYALSLLRIIDRSLSEMG